MLMIYWKEMCFIERERSFFGFEFEVVEKEHTYDVDSG